MTDPAPRAAPLRWFLLGVSILAFAVGGLLINLPPASAEVPYVYSCGGLEGSCVWTVDYENGTYWFTMTCNGSVGSFSPIDRATACDMCCLAQ